MWHYFKYEKEKTEENIDQKTEKLQEEITIIDVISDGYQGALDHDLIQSFTCMICVGIAVDP